jgi:serine phosphatase RsbU (regulator of sigma subunit)/putative methionine-R-sulfoxide reductase with GAF domain
MIRETVSALLEARTELWLDERLSRLPGAAQDPVFPLKPSSDLMRKVLNQGCSFIRDDAIPAVAVTLCTKDRTLGVLQVKRSKGLKFRKVELDLLEGVAGHIALALMASHRFIVEQWRIEQLTLVRQVSAQIANVFDLQELTRRVTKLIQRTFHYYYVAVFTLDQDRNALEFRSSASQLSGRAKRIKSTVGKGLIGITAQTGDVSIVNDVQVDERFRFVGSLPETRSEAVLPLKVHGRILGVLDVQSDQLDAFHPNDVLVLQALADTTAIAINGARLYTELQMRLEHLAMVAEVSDDITSILDLDQLFTKVAVLIQGRLGFPHVHVFTVHPNRRQIIYEAGSGARSTSLAGYVLNLDTEEGIIAWVARNGKVVLANDVSQEPRYRPSAFPPEDTHAELAIPLIYDNQVVGVLDLQSDRINAFSDADLFLCEALADNVAVAIHNAELYRTERWRRQIADSLREVAGVISAETGVDDVLELILRELERSLPCDVATIWLLEGERLHLARIRGGDMEEVEEASRRWPESYAFLSSALSSDEPVIRKPDDAIGPVGTALGLSADYSSIAAGLRAGDRPLGVLTLSHHAAGRYGHEAQAITSTFANYAAVAIENVRLFDAAQEQAYASAALLQVAQAVANSNSLEETIGSVVRITPILVGVKACAIYLWEADHFHPTQSYGFSDAAQVQLWGRDFIPGDFPLLDAVRENARTIVGVLTSEIAEDFLDPELARTEQETFYALQSSDHLLIGLPLMIKNELYGAMIIEEDSDARRFRQKRVEIVTSIAQQVALSLQNEQLQMEMVARERLEHEVQLARQIQKTLLPDHLPELPGWDLAATWITARQVGGDFYDVIELPGQRLGLFIADVSDKGIPAALFMALTRTLVRAVVYDTSSPAEVMQRVNALILPDNQQDMFVTAVYAVLSLESGEFVYANAGHNPPIWVYGKDRKMEILRRTGAALGIMDEYSMEERTIQFNSGDFILLYTDGLTEAFSPEEETYGEEHLQQVLGQVSEQSAREVLDALEASVKHFMGPLSPADDLTMLGIRKII